ncbi:unnamed protein product [Boreogadus saida]
MARMSNATPVLRQLGQDDETPEEIITRQARLFMKAIITPVRARNTLIGEPKGCSLRRRLVSGGGIPARTFTVFRFGFRRRPRLTWRDRHYSFHPLTQVLQVDEGAGVSCRRRLAAAFCLTAAAARLLAAAARARSPLAGASGVRGAGRRRPHISFRDGQLCVSLPGPGLQGRVTQADEIGQSPRAA